LQSSKASKTRDGENRKRWPERRNQAGISVWINLAAP